MGIWGKEGTKGPRIGLLFFQAWEGLLEERIGTVVEKRRTRSLIFGIETYDKELSEFYRKPSKSPRFYISIYWYKRFGVREAVMGINFFGKEAEFDVLPQKWLIEGFQSEH